MHQSLGFGTGLSLEAQRFVGTAEGERFAEKMAGVGDINGDGFDDLAVGAPYYHPDDPLLPRAREYGRVYLFFGSRQGISRSNVQMLEGAFDGEQRASPARAGDVNGDGYADVLIEGLLWDSENRGVSLHLGGPGGLSAESIWNIPYDPFRPRCFGSLGDLTGDGRAEVAIAVAPITDGDSAYELYIYAGTETGLTEEPIQIIPESVTGKTYSGAGVGDFTGNGYPDLFLGVSGCPGWNTMGLWGGSDGLSQDTTWASLDVDCALMTYKETERVGDLNGDGLADVFTGSGSYARFDFEGYTQGFYGGATPDDDADWGTGFPDNVSGWIDVAGVGDVNGDGFNDVVIGLDYYFNPSNGVVQGIITYPPMGQARLFLGSAAGLETTHSWYAYDETLNGNSFGEVVKGAGDLNGDGFADVAVGDPFASTDETVWGNQGFLYIFYGTGGEEPSGRVLWNLQAFESGSDEPVAGGAQLESTDGFDVGAVGLGTQGRTFVAMEVEVKPSVLEFDGQDLMRDDVWHDTGVTGVSMRLPITGLTSGTAYKLRARLIYRPDTPTLTRHTRWFTGPSLATKCASTDPDFDQDGLCDTLDEDDDEDGTVDGDDCAPLDPTVHPGQTDSADDSIDQDCSGADSVTCYVDADGDGYGSAQVTLGEGSCTAEGLAPQNTDCDDDRPSVYPDATEVPDDAIDQNCDDQDHITCFIDADGDGFGAQQRAVPEEDCPADGISASGGDCHDGNREYHPDAEEIPDDGIDQDCSGADSATCYVDEDGDGFGTESTTIGEGGCSKSGVALDSGDCDDEDENAYPGALEIAEDGKDQDCDGSDSVVCFNDNDEDGFGDPDAAFTLSGDCTTLGFSDDSSDCDDNDPLANPNATEIPGNAVDEDCDGIASSEEEGSEPSETLASNDTDPASDEASETDDAADSDEGCGCLVVGAPHRTPLPPAALLPVALSLLAMRRRKLSSTRHHSGTSLDSNNQSGDAV